MKIDIIPGAKGETPYMMVTMDRQEAWRTVRSMVAQLSEDDPNFERLESRTDGNGKRTKTSWNGFFSICVRDLEHCIRCGKEIPPHGGKRERVGLLCLEHPTHEDIEEEAKTKRLEAAWKKQTKAAKTQKRSET